MSDHVIAPGRYYLDALRERSGRVNVANRRDSQSGPQSLDDSYEQLNREAADGGGITAEFYARLLRARW